MSAAPSQLPTVSFEAESSDNWFCRRRRIVVVTSLSIVLVLNAIGLLLVARRLLGALTVDLPWPLMLSTAVVVTAVAACVRIAWRKSFPFSKFELFGATRKQLAAEYFVGGGASTGLVLIAVGCCFPGYRTIDWLIWLPMLIADQFWRQSFFDSGRPGKHLGDAMSADEEVDASAISFPSAEKIETNYELDPRTQEIVQQLFRLREEDGTEVIYGTLRADFQTGQRTAVLHVGFCPPLSHLPEIEADQLPGPEAKIKVVQALAHGVRMDVRLTQPAEENCQLWIDMAATPASGMQINQ